MIANPKINL